MKRPWRYLSLAVGLTVLQSSCTRTTVADRALLDSLADSSQVVQALRLLRSGDTNAAISVLEQMLDGELLALASDAEQTPDALVAEGGNAVQRLLAYRAQYPRFPSNAEYASALTNAVRTLEGAVSNR